MKIIFTPYAPWSRLRLKAISTLRFRLIGSKKNNDCFVIEMFLRNHVKLLSLQNLFCKGYICSEFDIFTSSSANVAYRSIFIYCKNEASCNYMTKSQLYHIVERLMCTYTNALSSDE